MSGSEASANPLESLFANDSPVLSVISKKIRNRKKKLDKVTQKIMEHHKNKSKKVDPEDEAKREKLEAQVKELEEMRQGIKDEGNKLIQGMSAPSQPQSTNEKAVDGIISNAVGRVADALLINLLQNQFNKNSVLGDKENEGLNAVLVPLQSILSPPGDSIVYDRARDCFVEIFTSLAKGSEDIIPGSQVTFRHLTEQIDLIPARVKNSEHSANSASAPVEETKVAPQAAQESAPAEATKAAPKKETKKKPEIEEKEPTIEQLAEEDAKAEQVTIRPTQIKSDKRFIDEDGFVHTKAHYRPAHEHDQLKKKFRNNRQARKNHNERYHVRGGKPLRGRGGRGHHDKHDLDDKGRKDKKAHGKHSNWKKGEVRVEGADN